MEVSEVRVRLIEDANDRLRAVCTVTLDDEFVIRDVKVVEGAYGLFVAMPSRKLTVPCNKCRNQNHLRAKFCNECGTKLPPARIPTDDNGREKVHRDIAHPITPDCRQAVQEKVIEAYREESGEREDAPKRDVPREREEREAPQERETMQEPDAHEAQPAITDAHDDADVDTGEDRDEPRVGESLSEYNALIADLKGGGGRDRAERGGEGSRDGRGRRGGRRRSGRDRDRSAEDRPSTAPQREDRQPAPAEKREPAAPRPQAPPPPASRPAPVSTPVSAPVDPFDDDVPFGANLSMTEPVKATPPPPPPPRKEPARAPEPVAEPEPSEVAQQASPPDDEGGFGEGIL